MHATSCHPSVVRATRVIYVENDPALRAIMTGLLAERPEVDIILAAGTPDDALQREFVEQADAALIDLALGADQMNGIDVGLAMREINDNIGIVIHSQYRLDSVARQVPAEAIMGWATLAKTGSLSLDEIVDALREAARGVTSVHTNATLQDSPLQDMTIRQRAVMGMMASGINTQEIARRLGISHAAVRQDLTRAYRLLVPDVGQTDELRTRAILAYLELIRDDDSIDGT